MRTESDELRSPFNPPVKTYHATTLTDTCHGPPWSKRLEIPAGCRVVVQDATNQPEGPDNIRYWMVGWATRPLVEGEPAEVLINGYGIGFFQGDLRIANDQA
jgi:hypothetical protein